MTAFMKDFLLSTILVGAVAGLGAFAIVLWLGADPTVGWAARRPGDDMRGATAPAENAASTEGVLTLSSGTASNLPGAWPRFRNAGLDNISTDGVRLADGWDDAPPLLWSIDVGEGHAGAAIRNGRVYLLDYDRPNSSDALRCLSLDDGAEIWRYSYRVKVKRNHGMSRTVPAVTDEYVVALGPKCHVTCLDATRGELLWQIDLVRAFGTSVPPWYAGQCPLIDKGRVILAPGGTALLAAVDCATGAVLWETPNPDRWAMTHSSIVPMEFARKRFFIYCGSGGVVGVADDDGALLWKTTDWKIRIANVPSPLIVDRGRIFFSGGYEAGSLMLALRDDDGRLTPETLFRLGPEIFGSAQQTPVFYEGHIYGVRPDEQLVCLDVDGKVVWASGAAHKFGLGPYMIADGKIFAMNDSGLLRLVKATSGGYYLLDQADLLDGHDSWAPMALAAGRLICRDLTRMVCVDLSAN